MDILNCLLMGIILILGYLLYKKPSPRMAETTQQEKQSLTLLEQINAMILQLAKFQMELAMQALVPEMLKLIKDTPYKDMRIEYQRKFKEALSCIGDGAFYLAKSDEYRQILYKSLRFPNPEEAANGDQEFFSHFETVEVDETKQRAV